MSQGVAAEQASPGDEYMTPGEAATALRVHRSTLGRYLAAGLITAITLPSGHRRYPRAAVDAIRAAGTGDARRRPPLIT